MAAVVGMNVLPTTSPVSNRSNSLRRRYEVRYEAFQVDQSRSGREYEMGAILLSHVLQTDLEGQRTEASSQQIAVLVHFRFAGSKERK
jgi:hypothetical protein